MVVDWSREGNTITMKHIRMYHSVKIGVMWALNTQHDIAGKHVWNIYITRRSTEKKEKERRSLALTKYAHDFNNPQVWALLCPFYKRNWMSNKLYNFLKVIN